MFKRSKDNAADAMGSSTRIVTCRFFAAATKSSTLTLFRSLLFLVLHAVPFLCFLAIYGANRRLGLLPTDAYQDVRLHNVTAWERIFLPLDPPIHRILSAAHHPVLDLFATVPYLAHYTLPVVGPLLLLVYFRRFDGACRFYLHLGVSMWILYVVWYLLPTAPPWFYTQEEEKADVVPKSAASVMLDSGKQCREGVVFARVDRMLGFSMFHQMFASNPVPFAAFPSGHVTWPTCLVLNLPVSTWKRLAVGGGYVALVAWATMYTTHHYFADVVVAILVVLVVDWLIASNIRSTADADDSIHRTDEEGKKMELAELGLVQISLPGAPCQSRYVLSRKAFIL